jgi:hypothetical protein
LAKLTGAEVTVVPVTEDLPPYISHVPAVSDLPVLLKRQPQVFYSDLHRGARKAAPETTFKFHKNYLE